MQNLLTSFTYGEMMLVGAMIVIGLQVAFGVYMIIKYSQTDFSSQEKDKRV